MIAFGSQAQADTITKRDSIFYMPEVDASFPGGIDSLFAYLQKNLRWPGPNICVQGKVFVKFVVGKDGTISNAMVQIGIPGCKQCDEEALRLVREMPLWIPAKDKGVVVNWYFHLPVRFALN